MCFQRGTDLTLSAFVTSRFAVESKEELAGRRWKLLY